MVSSEVSWFTFAYHLDAAEIYSGTRCEMGFHPHPFFLEEANNQHFLISHVLYGK